MLSESSCVNIASQEKWHKQKWQQLWGYIKLFMPTTPHSAKFSKTLESLLEMVYMFSNFWLLADGSRDLSQAKKEKKYLLNWENSPKGKNFELLVAKCSKHDLFNFVF